MARGAGGCLRVRQRKASGGERRDSARRRAARGEQREAPGCARGTAQGAGLREADQGDSARRRATRVAFICI
eukprot:1282579-Pleurochrysis_carterae.AAC.1